MIMGILSFAVLIWRVKLTVQWALTGAHPSITALWFTYPRRGSPKWQKLYSERTAVERAFSRLKENLGLNNITVRGIRKTRVLVLLSCIALIAGTIAVNVSKESDKAA